MLKFGMKQYVHYEFRLLSQAKFERRPNRLHGGVYRCPEISIFGQIWSFPVSRPSASKINVLHLLLQVRRKRLPLTVSR